MEEKILILGGTTNTSIILHTAHEIGLKVGVVDYYKESKCKREADYAHLIDAFDVDNISKLISEKNYNGIIVGYSEKLLKPYARICKLSNKPCYGSEYLFDISSNKEKFRKLCTIYGVPMLPSYTEAEIKKDPSLLPVVVKPVDSAASIGITFCRKISELEPSIKFAQNNSPTKSIVIEKMASGKEATFFYYIKEGKPYLTAIADRLTTVLPNQNKPMPVGYIFPAQIEKQKIIDFNNQLKKLIRGEKYKDGMLFAQVFVEPEKIYLCEVGYRLTPSFETFIINDKCGFDIIKEMIYTAINKKSPQTLPNFKPDKGFYGNVTLSLKEGVISEYKGIDTLESLPYVIKVFQAFEIGHEIRSEHIDTLAQVGLRIILKADTLEELMKRMNIVKNLVEILDTHKNNMVIPVCNF